MKNHAQSYDTLALATYKRMMAVKNSQPKISTQKIYFLTETNSVTKKLQIQRIKPWTMEKKTVAALLAVIAVAGVGATVTDGTKGKTQNYSIV